MLLQGGIPLTLCTSERLAEQRVAIYTVIHDDEVKTP